MYSELIYTRCGEGVDILKGRNPILNSGFKVFSCSESITEEGLTDLQFLDATAKRKETYSDPLFMDDAYLYFVPDIGEKIYLDFHPIHFDEHATGDYSHRPGNFINQVFVGKFENFYPYELFGADDVWDAKKRGEAFYYENPPFPLAERDCFGERKGYISFEDIASFVADGRKDVLMSAIAFIVSQYSIPPEERKFLVIRDTDSKKIELWIAAIESAFSPRMAAGLSFASRLDNYVNSNKYTVNLDGRYQTQINLQSPNQKLRFRAMIVGVDERDQKNSVNTKVLANSPYVVLDGKTKTISTSIDKSNPFYRCATSFDDDHKYLCREYMQMASVENPTEAVLGLFSSFAYLKKYRSSKKLNDLLSALRILGQFTLNKTDCLSKIYVEAKREIQRFLNEDITSAFELMKELAQIASIVGDIKAKDDFTAIISQTYAEKVFSQPQSKSTIELSSAIKKSPFFHNVSEYLISKATIVANCSTVRAYASADWVSLTEYLLDAVNCCSGKGLSDIFELLLPNCIMSLSHSKDYKSAVKIASSYYAKSQQQTIEVVLSVASKSTDQELVRFLILLICGIVPERSFSDSYLLGFFKLLQRFNLRSFFPIVLAYRAKTLSQAQEMEKYLCWIGSNRELEGMDLSETFIALDNNLSLSDKMAHIAAEKIQKLKPKGVSCRNSAHIYALDLLDKNRGRELIPLLNSMVSQGVPSIENDSYADSLANRLFGIELPEEAFSIVVSAAANSSYYLERIVEEAMRNMGSKKKRAIGDLVEVACQAKMKTLEEAIISACVDAKHFDKDMQTIRETIRTREAQQYFTFIAKEATTRHDQMRKPSLFNRLFSPRKPNDSSQEESGKK